MPSPPARLLFLGCGTFAVQALEIAEGDDRYTPVGFINSFEVPARDAQLEGLPVWGIDSLPFRPGEALVVSGAVSNRRRAALETLAQRGYGFATLVHTIAFVSRRATLHPGCVINSGAQISVYADIGGHVIVNRGALIGHNTRIGAYATVGPGAVIAGSVEIGPGAYIGVGSVVREGSVIGAGAVVGAGAVIVKSVPERTQVTGVPARVVKTGVDGL